MPDSRAVNNLFSAIAPRYDLTNRILSAGIDIIWRRVLVDAVALQSPARVLDLAAGSGDVTLALAKKLGSTAEIIGADFCQPMLDEAERKKSVRLEVYSRVAFQWADALNLPYLDNSFDAVTIAFGLRNMASRETALHEMRRVLRPGGTLFILEFSQPAPWIRPLYYFYIKRMLPTVAGILTKNRAAYVYLNETIAEFPDRAGLEEEICQAGFLKVNARGLTGGIAALHRGVK